MTKLARQFLARPADRLQRTGVILGIALLVAAGLPGFAHAQSFNVVYNFGNSGFYPVAGVTVDRGGNLYGTTEYGGPGQVCFLGCGTVFKLSRHNSSWQLTPLYNFVGNNDGGNPTARPVIGPDGSLFGTTNQGGGTGCFGSGCGTVYNLRPPVHIPNNILGGWTETVLYRFLGGDDGGGPESADLLFDAAGSIYGTTLFGGGSQCFEDCGTAYKLTRTNGVWSEQLLHVFGQSGDADQPYAGMVFDQAGNLYGATASGGASRQGAVYQLLRNGVGWTEHVLHSFQGNDGAISYSRLIFDPAGNLYGTTCCYGANGGGSVFELTAGSWAFNVLYNLGAPGTGNGSEGALIMDAAGNLYGTTSSGGASNFGTVFKLTPGLGGWTYTSIHDFCPGGFPCADGYTPSGSLAMDSAGNLYGTTANGGSFGGGVVYEITP